MTHSHTPDRVREILNAYGADFLVSFVPGRDTIHASGTAVTDKRTIREAVNDLKKRGSRSICGRSVRVTITPLDMKTVDKDRMCRRCARMVLMTSGPIPGWGQEEPELPGGGPVA